MKSILIRKKPDGFAEESIRRRWIGVLIPLPTEDEIAVDPPSKTGTLWSEETHYLVLRESAVKALRYYRRWDAATYWESLPGRYLSFKKEDCELIE
jgi:hypothetical protein